MQLPEPRILRLGLLSALVGGYIALFGYGMLTETPTASAAADLYVAVILFGAVTGRVWLDGVGEGTQLLETAAFLVAGLAIGYAGLAGLSVVPTASGVDTLGNLAILVALVLLVHRRRSVSEVA